MFVTLRCNKDSVSVEKAPVITNNGTRPRHAACDNCRAKKLKCSGDKTSCLACTTGNKRCTYSSSSSHGKNRRGSRNVPPRTPGSQRPTARNSPEAESRDPEITRASSPNHVTTSPISTPIIPCLPTSGTEPALSSTADTSQINFNDDDFLQSLWSPGDMMQIDETLGGATDALSFELDDYLSSNRELIAGFPSIDGPASNLDLDNTALTSIPPLPGIFSGQNGQKMEDGTPGNIGAVTHLHLQELDRGISSKDFSADPCTCLSDAVVVLESLEIQSMSNHQSSANTIDRMLSSNKHAIAKCIPMLDCSKCHCISSRLLLFILIGRSLVLQFERLLKLLASPESDSLQASPIHSLRKSSDSIVSMASESGGSLGNYSIDTPEEWKEMLRALAVVQGRSLGAFLGRMKSAISHRSWCWMPHQTMLDEIESRHRTLMGDLYRGDTK